MEWIGPGEPTGSDIFNTGPADCFGRSEQEKENQRWRSVSRRCLVRRVEPTIRRSRGKFDSPTGATCGDWPWMATIVSLEVMEAAGFDPHWIGWKVGYGRRC